jgi:hypothetical protein
MQGGLFSLVVLISYLIWKPSTLDRHIRQEFHGLSILVHGCSDRSRSGSVRPSMHF